MTPRKVRIKDKELEQLVDTFEGPHVFEQPQVESVDIDNDEIRVRYHKSRQIAPLSQKDLFTSFAKLSARGRPTESQIERWVGRFGLPARGAWSEGEGARSKDAMVGNGPMSMSVNDFRKETGYAHELLRLYSLIRGKHAAQIKEMVRKRRNHDEASALDRDFLEKFEANRHSILVKTNDKRVPSYREVFPHDMSEFGTSSGAVRRFREFEGMINLLAAQSALGEIVTRLVGHVSLRVGVQRGQGLVPSFRCPDLKSAIYLQFYSLVTKNKAPRFCENPACGELFFPTKSNQRHCPGASCRSNARHYRKH
jgi:hypothetical protein